MGDAEFEASKRQRAANRQCGPALGGTARLLVFEPGVIGTRPLLRNKECFTGDQHSADGKIDRYATIDH